MNRIPEDWKRQKIAEKFNLDINDFEMEMRKYIARDVWSDRGTGEAGTVEYNARVEAFANKLFNALKEAESEEQNKDIKDLDVRNAAVVTIEKVMADLLEDEGTTLGGIKKAVQGYKQGMADLQAEAALADSNEKRKPIDAAVANERGKGGIGGKRTGQLEEAYQGTSNPYDKKGSGFRLIEGNITYRLRTQAAREKGITE